MTAHFCTAHPCPLCHPSSVVPSQPFQADPKDARIAQLESALAKAEEALVTCTYQRQNEDGTEYVWCASCGDILEAVNMKGERRIYSHTFGCQLESALAAIEETRQ